MRGGEERPIFNERIWLRASHIDGARAIAFCVFARAAARQITHSTVNRFV